MTSIVVHRAAEAVVIMMPEHNNDESRYYAIISEDESFCASSTIKRMVAMRDDMTIELGSPADKLCVRKVSHPGYPMEIVFEDDEGRVIIDLKREEALVIADMLWGAYRSANFYMSATIVSQARREVKTRHAAWPVDAEEAARARTLGETRRRARGEGLRDKD